MADPQTTPGQDKSDAERYRFLRDRGSIAFLKYGKEVDDLVDKEMAKPKEEIII